MPFHGHWVTSLVGNFICKLPMQGILRNVSGMLFGTFSRRICETCKRQSTSHLQIIWIAVLRYQASTTFEWEPDVKKKELFHSLARFILVTPVADPVSLLAFLNFRFEVEDEQDIIYW